MAATPHEKTPQDDYINFYNLMDNNLNCAKEEMLACAFLTKVIAKRRAFIRDNREPLISETHLKQDQHSYISYDEQIKNEAEWEQKSIQCEYEIRKLLENNSASIQKNLDISERTFYRYLSNLCSVVEVGSTGEVNFQSEPDIKSRLFLHAWGGCLNIENLFKLIDKFKQNNSNSSTTNSYFFELVIKKLSHYEQNINLGYEKYKRTKKVSFLLNMLKRSFLSSFNDSYKPPQMDCRGVATSIFLLYRVTLLVVAIEFAPHNQELAMLSTLNHKIDYQKRKIFISHLINCIHKKDREEDREQESIMETAMWDWFLYDRKREKSILYFSRQGGREATTERRSELTRRHGSDDDRGASDQRSPRWKRNSSSGYF